MLALSLEQGREALVPKRLGQKHLALSFQYYDSITECVRQFVTDDLKVYLCTYQEEEQILKKNLTSFVETLEKKRGKTKDFMLMKNDIKRDSQGQIEISHGERFVRFFKRYVKGFEKFADDKNYKKELTMFDKS